MKILMALIAVALAVVPVMAQNAMSVDDVVTLHKAGISESILISRIKQANKPAELSTDDLLKLAQAKVPDSVIQALMNPGAGTAAPAPSPAPASAPPPSASPARSATAGKGATTASAAPAAPATDTSSGSPNNATITVRPVMLPKAQIDIKKKELDASSPKPKGGGLAGRLAGAVGNSVTGDENKRKAAEFVMHTQAHDVLIKENGKTVIVAVGKQDVIDTVKDDLAEFKREFILLHLDPSAGDKNSDNGAIQDGLAGGLAGMATNVWVYLPKSVSDTGDAKPDHTLSTKAPARKQLWTAIFTSDGDLPPQLDEKLSK